MYLPDNQVALWNELIKYRIGGIAGPGFPGEEVSANKSHVCIKKIDQSRSGRISSCIYGG